MSIIKLMTIVIINLGIKGLKCASAGRTGRWRQATTGKVVGHVSGDATAAYHDIWAQCRHTFACGVHTTRQPDWFANYVTYNDTYRLHYGLVGSRVLLFFLYLYRSSKYVLSLQHCNVRHIIVLIIMGTCFGYS